MKDETFSTCVAVTAALVFGAMSSIGFAIAYYIVQQAVCK